MISLNINKKNYEVDGGVVGRQFIEKPLTVDDALQLAVDTVQRLDGFGGAYLAHGEFLKDAPNAPNEGDTTYIYAQALATF